MMAAPFFFKTGIQPVRKVIVGRNEGPLTQTAENFGWEHYSTDGREVVRRDDIDAVSIGIASQKQCFRPAIQRHTLSQRAAWKLRPDMVE